MRSWARVVAFCCAALSACAGEKSRELLDELQNDSGIGNDGAVEAPRDASSESDAGRELDGAPGGHGDGDGGGSNGDDAGADSGPPRIEAYVNADNGDDTNAGTAAEPLKTLKHAFEVVGERGLVWLQPSSFTNANEGLAGQDTFTGVSAPSDTSVRGTAAGVNLSVAVQFPAGGSLENVTLDLTNMGRVLASSGELLLRELTWERSAAGGGVTTALEITGDAVVTVEPGSDPSHDYFGGANAIPAFATVRDSAALRVLGGTLDGASGAGFGNLIDLADTATLALRDFTFANTASTWVSSGAVVWMGSVGNSVLIEDTTIDLNGGNAACLVQDDNYAAGLPTTATLTIRNSVFTRCGGGGIQLRESNPVVVIEGSELSASTSRYGLETGQIGFDSVKVAGRPQVTLTDTVIAGNYLAGIQMHSGGSLTIQGGSITTNGGPGGYGGIYLQGDFPYTFSMRSVTVSDNDAASGYAGIFLMGDTASSFDLGTLASPGNNTLTGNAHTQLRVSVAADVLVSAVGNRWNDAQDSDAQGYYTVAGTLCANDNPCDQTSGTGSNFSFVSAGANARLRLAQE